MSAPNAPVAPTIPTAAAERAGRAVPADGVAPEGELRGTVARILPFSAVDGPGNRAVVFLQGCDFDCIYCHNPETRAQCIHCGICVPVCPSGALSMHDIKSGVAVTAPSRTAAVPTGAAPNTSAPLAAPGDAARLAADYALRVSWDPTRCSSCGACIAACPYDSSPKTTRMSPAEVLDRLKPYRHFLSGITISGGECGLQPEFLLALLLEASARGLPGLVDTNGSLDYSRQPELVRAAQGFMLDVKAWDEAEHLALTGAPNTQVIANLRFLAKAKKLYEVRTVVVPGQLDAAQTVREVSRILVDQGSDARYKIIRFRPQGVRKAWSGLPSPDDATMEALADLALSAGLRDVVLV